jgi:hypothetical protein
MKKADPRVVSDRGKRADRMKTLVGDALASESRRPMRKTRKKILNSTVYESFF